MTKDTKSSKMLIRFRVVDDHKTQEESYQLELNPAITLQETRQELEVKLPIPRREIKFLFKNRRVKIDRERSHRLIDILPKLKKGIPLESFKFKNVQYQKVEYVKNGEKIEVTCCGIVFVWKESGGMGYNEEEFQSVISGPHLYGFSFIPSTILSSHSDYDHIGKMCEMAAYGLDNIQNLLVSCSSKILDEFVDHEQTSPLHHAATSGHSHVCKLLVNHFGSQTLQFKDQNGRTPLHCALIRKRMDVIMYMLSFKPDLDAKDVLGVSCRKLLFKLPPSKIDYLLDNIDLSILDDRIILFFTCLAFQRNNIAAGRELCKIVKPVPSSFFKQPLHLAAEVGNLEYVKLLINKEGSNSPSHSPLEYDRNGHLPLHYACQHGHCDIIPFVYSDVLTDRDFQRATKLAVNWRKFDVLLCLSELRSDFILDRDLQNILIDEAEKDLNKNGKLISPVLKSIPHANQRIVSEAARQNNIDLIKLLSSLDIRLDLKDEMGRTPLHEACQQGHCEMISFLLDHGVACHLQDWQGSTALHYACRTGNLDIISLLLDDVNISNLVDVTDNKGRSPLLTAAYSGHTDVVVYLLKYTSCDVWLVDIYDKSLLNYMVLLNTTSIPVIFDILRKCKFEDKTNENVLVQSQKRHLRRLKTTTFQCSLCGKRWRVFNWHKSFTHMCFQNGKKMLKKIKRWKPNTCNITKLPRASTIHNQTYTDIVTSAIEANIIADQTEHLDLLLNMLDIDLSMDALSFLCGLCGKYFSLECLDIVLNLWTISTPLLSELLLIVTIMEAKTEKSRSKRLEMVRVLLQVGACPNFLIDNLSDDDCKILNWTPDMQNSSSKEDLQSDISNDTFDRLLLRLSMTKESMGRSCYQPLELAVIDKDLPLVKCLLEGGASPQICFASHLSILKGHCYIMDYLLNIPTVPQSVRFLGKGVSIQTMFDCCTDNCGMLQALSACEGSVPIQNILSYIPNLLQSKKLLTTSIVKSFRLRLFHYKDLEIHKILYQHWEKSDGHLQQLPLTKLMILNSASDVLLNGVFKYKPHLYDTEVDKAITIHCACEMFAASVDRKLWEKCHQILSTDLIQIIWKCLLGTSSYCTRNVYKCGESAHPILSRVVIDFISKAPMECVDMFFAGLKRVISNLGIESLQDVALQLKNAQDESFEEDTTFDKSTLLKETVLCLFANLKDNHHGLYCASRILSVLPEFLRCYLEEELVFKTKRNSYFQLALVSIDFQPDSKGSVRKLVNQVNLVKPEVRLMKMLQKLSFEQKNTIMDKDISLAELACIYGELYVLKASLSYLDTATSLNKLLDVAAGFGYQNIIKYLINEGAVACSSTISSSCDGPAFSGLSQWEPKMKKVHKEKLVLQTLQCIIRLTDPHSFPECYVDVLENSIRMYYWSITRWCLDNFEEHTCLPNLSEEVMMIVIASGPEDVCLKILNLMSFDWTVLSQEGACTVVNTAVKRNDQVTNFIRPILSSYKFDGFLHLEQQDKHKRTFLHFVCAQGRMGIVEIIFNQLSVCNHHKINEILNIPDASNATPLWYALSNHHWDLAKMLLLNGCVLSKMMTVHLTRKREYVFGKKTLLESHHRGQVTLARKGMRSCEVADRVGSNRLLFEEMYDSSPCIHNVPKDRYVLEKVNPLLENSTRSEVRLLIDLMWQSLKLGTSLLNVAIGTLNSQLVFTIQTQPLKKVFFDDVYESPVVYAIVNNNGVILNSIEEYDPGDHLTSAILRIALGETSMSNIEDFINRASVQFPFDKQDSQNYRKLFEDAKRIVDQTSNIPCFQHCDLNQNIPWNKLKELAVSSNRCKKQFLSEPVLFLSAVLGLPWLFEIIKSSCNSDREYMFLITSSIFDKLSVVDMILIFGSKDKMSSLAKKDNDNRIECLKTIPDNKYPFKFQNITWNIIEDKRLYTVVTPILKQITIDQLVDDWANRVQEATKYGYEEFVIKLSDKVIENVNFRKWLPKLICLSALFGRSDIFFHYIDIHLCDVDFMTRVPNISWHDKIVEYSILECTIINNNLGMVKHIAELIRIGDQLLDIDTVCETVKLAYRKGNVDVIKTLESLTSSLGCANDISIDELCLIAASNGHDEVVQNLLRNHNIDITVTDQCGYNVFDYACIYGFGAITELLVSKKLVDTSSNQCNLARSFGHVRIHTVLTVDSYSTSNEVVSMPCGWFRSLMYDNELTANNDMVNLTYFKNKRLSLTLENLLKIGDDRGAMHYCKAAHHVLASMMEKEYEKVPLLHLCARYKNNSTLKVMLDLLNLYSQKEPSSWLCKEFQGKVPIVTAIECGNTEAVSLLVHPAAYNNWRYRNGETVLHIAAKSGNDDMVQMLQESSPTHTSVTDGLGLIPASTAVAMGNHYILHHLYGPETANPCNHSNTNFNCFDCLRNYCIGWFKCLHSGRISSQPYPARNIHNRIKSNSGYRQNKKGSGKRVYHPIQKILAWRTISKSNQIMNAALYVMGYPQDSVNGELFLLLNEMGCKEKIFKHAVKRKMATVVLRLLQNDKQMTQLNLMEIAYRCAGHHLNEVLQWIHLSRIDITTSPTRFDQCVLDAAYGMGNKEIINLFESTMDGAQRFEKLGILRDLVNNLPFGLKCRIKPQEFKVCKIIRKRDRLSDLDVIHILPKSLINEVFQNFDFHHNGVVVFPRKIFGKPILVETESLRLCAKDSNLSELDVTSILFSKLVIGRYHEEISKYSNAWLEMSKVVVRCHNHRLVGPSACIEDGILYDDINLVHDKHSQQWIVVYSELPKDILPDPQYEIQVEMKLRDIERNIRSCIPGSCINVTVDWTFLDESEHSNEIIKVLANDSSSNPLNQLDDSMSLVGDVLKDVWSMYNKDTKQNLLNLLAPISCIEINYSEDENLHDHSFIPNLQEKLLWKFRIDNGRVRCFSPLVEFVSLLHSVYINLRDGVLKLQSSTKKQRGSSLVLDVDWNSFALVESYKDVHDMVNNCIRIQLSQCGSLVAKMPFLELDIKKVAVKVVSQATEAGVELNDQVLHVSIYVAKSSSGVWSTTEFDFSRAFQIFQTNQIFSVWKTQSKTKNLVDKIRSSLQNRYGFTGSLRLDIEVLLDSICREYSNMTHPLRLFSFEMEHFAQYVNVSFHDEFKRSLDTSNYCWRIGNCKSDTGMWCWLTKIESETLIPETPIFTLSKSKSKKSRLIFRRAKTDNFNVLCFVNNNNLPESRNIDSRARGQILTFDNTVYYVADPVKACYLLEYLNHSFEFSGNATADPGMHKVARYTALENVILRRDLFISQLPCTLMYQCWNKCIQLGVNFVMEPNMSLDYNQMLEVLKLLDGITKMLKSVAKAKGLICLKMIQSTDGTVKAERCGDDLYIFVQETLEDSGSPFESLDLDDVVIEDYDDCDVELKKHSL